MRVDLRALIIIVGISVMLLLALAIIFFVILYQRRIIAHQIELKKISAQKELELIQASIQSEEEERTRIASELHDDVAATLSSARLFLYKTKDAQYDENVVNQSKELLDQSIAKVRDISHKLQPATLQHLGLEQSLQSIMETINRSGTVAATFIARAPLPRTAENVELAAYRISQELVANMLKHSGATTIVAATDFDGGQLVINFTHDGKGMTQDMYEALIYKKGSTGLKNIVNRLKSVNGVIRFYLDADEGYKTELSIPLPA